LKSENKLKEQKRKADLKEKAKKKSIRILRKREERNKKNTKKLSRRVSISSNTSSIQVSQDGSQELFVTKEGKNNLLSI